MELEHIALFTGCGLVYLYVLPTHWRGWVVLIGSILAMYWLQPTLAIRWLDYSLPTATLIITAMCWFITRNRDNAARGLSRNDKTTFGIVVATPILLTLPRYVDLPISITSRPPEPLWVMVFLILLGGTFLALQKQPVHRLVLSISVIGLVGLFIVLKSSSLSYGLSVFLRDQTGQDPTLANGLDIQWLGFSYIAFRLLHTLRDRQSGLLPDLTLSEYITFVIFFPVFAAGPIDRVERFVTDWRGLAQFSKGDTNRTVIAVTRIGIGLFKKFVVADTLAFFSLNSITFGQTQSSLGTWVLLYSYALRLYFDFSGYSDIAIGIGVLFGFQMPENFALPYLKNNITVFWQSWHMTLSNWVRAYVYSPLSRSLLRRTRKPSTIVIILICSLATMLVIGLWHGITIPFAIWGLWHGLGLFIHKLWSDRTRGWYRNLKQAPMRQRVWHFVGIFMTFHFVVLGWVWFVMPDLPSALRVYGSLIGIVR